MSKLVALAATLALALVFASPAVADGDDFVVGVNGVVTSPFDVVYGVVEGERLVDLGAANVVTDRVTGLGFGVKNALVRAGTGLFDALTFAFADKVGGPYSPEARVDAFAVLGGDDDAE